MSTIHSAKGLEWNSVFLIWVNEGRLPSARSAESEETLEEERRLLYVACTRAKERLYLTYPAVMLEWQNSDVLGRPSRFLDGISAEQFPKFYLSEEGK
ncbi:MAG: ATP-dependent helicase [Ignavibacteria bacterium]|nr:ATP-dependent helicase [Ignavibacteria bacterium]